MSTPSGRVAARGGGGASAEDAAVLRADLRRRHRRRRRRVPDPPAKKADGECMAAFCADDETATAAGTTNEAAGSARTCPMQLAARCPGEEIMILIMDVITQVLFSRRFCFLTGLVSHNLDLTTWGVRESQRVGRLLASIRISCTRPA